MTQTAVTDFKAPLAAPMIAVGGCKGGVGKTMVSLALLDYLLQRETPVLLVETDTSNPDVWRTYHAEEGVLAATLDLDRPEGWIDLINLCEAHPQRLAVINTAARNNRGVAAHGVTLSRALPELHRRLTTLWVINTQRDSVELLDDYLRVLPDTVVHVVRNTFFGAPETFDLYPKMNAAQEIARRGGHVLTLDRLANRVSQDLYTRRLPVSRALQRGNPDALPLGNRSELERWRDEIAPLFEIVLATARAPQPAPATASQTGVPQTGDAGAAESAAAA